MKIVFNLKKTDLKTVDALFLSLASSVLLYGTEAWGLRYLNNLDSFQSAFYKKLLGLPKYCPNYATRIETGIQQLSITAIDRSLRWLKKMMDMLEERYPKLCLMKLLTLANHRDVDIKYNWVKQLLSVSSVSTADTLTHSTLRKLIDTKMKKIF